MEARLFVLTYTQDSVGNVIVTSSWLGLTTMTYDPRDLLIGVVDMTGAITTNTYDAAEDLIGGDGTAGVPCYSGKEAPDTPYDPPPQPSAQGKRGKIPLMMSNNPERVDLTNMAPGTPSSGALWWHTVSNPASAFHRVFLWHLNKLNEHLNLSLTLENTGASNVVIAAVLGRWNTTATQVLSVGEDIAACYLRGLKPLGGQSPAPIYVAPSGLTIPPGATAKLATLDWPTGNLTAAMIEPQFTQLGSYRLKVVYHLPGTDPTTVTTEPPNPVPGQHLPHGRGSWPYAEMDTVINYTYGPDTGYQIYGPPGGFIFDASASGDQGSCPAGAGCPVTNTGPWGAIVHITLNVVNPTGCPVTVAVNLNDRGGPISSGAVQQPGGQVDLAARMKTTHATSRIGTFPVPPSGATYTFLWSIAGGSQTPVALEVKPVG